MVYSADKTIAEIFAAKQAGKTVVAAMAETDYPVEYLCLMCTAQVCLLTNTTNLDADTVTVDSFAGFAESNEDTWIRSTTNLPVIPSASSDYNGKVLGVESGDYALIDNTAPYFIHLKSVEDAQLNVVIQTTESAGDIESAASNGRPMCAVMDLSSGSTVSYFYLVVEKFINNNGAYELLLSGYNQDEQTKREYLTFEASSANDAFVNVTI